MAQLKLWAKARVRANTDAGKWLLLEIKRLKEGQVLVGTYTPNLERFEFVWKGDPAMLWVGDNCEIIEQEQIEYVVRDAEKYSDDGFRKMWEGNLIENWMEFDTLYEAKAFVKGHGGSLIYGAAIINADSTSSHYGDYLIEPYYRNTLQLARAALRQELK